MITNLRNYEKAGPQHISGCYTAGVSVRVGREFDERCPRHVLRFGYTVGKNKTLADDAVHHALANSPMQARLLAMRLMRSRDKINA